MAELLAAAVKARVTTIISGGTGSGKTTMLNALSAFISDKERLITIEDAAELQLQQPHVARMETRPPSIEGKGEIRQRELVKNALRMRPERIILGECRGEEAFDMLQAMNTGHEGSMATIHANNPREAISRLEQLIGMAGLPMTVGSIRGQISAAIRMIVQLQRLSDGKRRVTSIAEITGMEGDIVQMQEIYKFVRTGDRRRRHRAGPLPGDRRAPALPRRPHRQGDQDPRQLFRSEPAALAMFDIDPIYVFYGFAAVSAILFVEGDLPAVLLGVVLSQQDQSPPRADDESARPRRHPDPIAPRARIDQRRRLPASDRVAQQARSAIRSDHRLRPS